MRLDQAE